MSNTSKSMAGGIIRPALAAAMVMIVLLYIPTPYAAYEPGIVEPVTPMVKVVAGDPPGKGVFMLTTVKMTYANYWAVLRSVWDDDLELLKKKDLLGDKSQSEYAARLLYIMQNSQSNAIEAAYKEAKIPYEVAAKELVVTDVPPHQEGFRPGDSIKAVQGKKASTARSLAVLLREQAPGDELDWTIIRQGKELTLKIPLKALPQDETGKDLPQALGGIVLAEIRDLAPRQDQFKVSIAAGDIGGPSAGLMFALQTFDALTEGDLTNGLRIAGTGTISSDGKVGAIGGVAFKVTAAHRSGAELFLVPPGNAQEARAKAKALGTPMRIVPIATLHDAVVMLQNGSLTG
ncbi:PDZ domain-containing protein [Paenibacillus sp. GCM10012307]|uniref:PDZ domain-containing protein n=1 Tax=Paenibacillus roseus TaxID=2798579 RepID=A0A934J7S0_9BACL|nr:S16 family serine protease [Paenibacillus roseus]MBJ6363334.1 PDZ domain-containing protein [Paenibacillus roseus]